MYRRNETFEKSKYDLEHIIETLNSVKKYLNAVVIGGGEPTLKIDDVMRLKECCDAENFDWHMFTNGTNYSLINKCIIDNFKLGYAPSDSSKTLRYLTKKGYTVEEIVEAGIGINNNGFLDRFSSRVVLVVLVLLNSFFFFLLEKFFISCILNDNLPG